MSYNQQQGDEHLAYGEDYGQSRAGPGDGSDRGVIGDTFKKLKSKYDQYQSQQSQSGGQNYGYGSQGSSQGYYGQQNPSGGYGQSGQGTNYGQQGQNTGYGQQGQTTGYGQSGQNTGYGQQGSNTGYGQQNPSSGYGSSGQSQYSGGPPSQRPGQKPGMDQKIFGALHSTIQNIGSDVAGILGTQYKPPPGSQQYQGQQYQGQQYQGQHQGNYQAQNTAAYSQQPGLGRNRYDSFACEKSGNEVKWFVDGCGYFWAVSQALERARESVWILDWWLSPELYLRRPPSQNEQWRLDRVLGRAAQRGVKVNVIVYKEVTQALTLSSAHTKHALEAIHPNIAVFRHPDHTPYGQTAESSLVSAFEGLKLDAAGLAKMGDNDLKGMYGVTDDVILYWAHHEKLCIVDGQVAFMGGLDLCFGRWDLNQHSIADAHPTDLNMIAIPGQDYNNARIMDFSDVAHPFQNKLDRTKSSRMGWSDISISLQGYCVDDLRHHFVDRWNFIYDEKYNLRRDKRYTRIVDEFGHSADHPVPTMTQSQKIFHGQGQSQQPGQPPLQSQQYGQQPGQSAVQSQQYGQQTQQYGQQPGQGQSQQSFPPPPGSQPYAAPAWQTTQHSHTASSENVNPQSYQATGQSYGVDGRPTSSGYSQQQPAAGQQSFPPPPPGPPPAGQVGQYGQQDYSQTQSYQQPATQSYQQPTTQSYEQPATQSYQQTGTQAASTAQPTQSQVQPIQSELSAQPAEHQYAQGQTSQSTGPPYPVTQSFPAAGQSSQPEQSQYQAYSSAQGQTGQPQNPYEHQSYQAPAGSQTRGLDEGEVYDSGYNQGYGSERGVDDEYSGDRGFGSFKQQGRQFGSELSSIGNMISGGLQTKARQHGIGGQFLGGGVSQIGRPLAANRGPMICQVLRSCTTWSNGTPTEHSIQNAYRDVIEKSQHFVYIENQFFITATGDRQKPVQNLIGKALVDRIIRAARNGERYKVIVVIPSVPGFAGDLQDESSLGTRAIMEYQYNSINRGGNSIMELVAQAGYNPMDYIRFYNLRNYDRINTGNAMAQIQQQTGVRYEDARRQHDDMVGAGYGNQGYGTGVRPGAPGQQYQQYQNTAQQYGKGPGTRWDSVAECYMLGGTDIRVVPWDGPVEAELDAFVSEELYIHTKTLIADDRVVICGSANLNDRSQLGTHDSEIALLIDDPTPVQSNMAGQPWSASRFASSLRRQLSRKHLGLIRPQDMQRPDANFEPVGVPNNYDWGSPEDNLVSDPLSDTFQAFWNTRARTNTEVFRKAFRAVPDDNVHSWSDYREFYEYYFRGAETVAEGKKVRQEPRVQYGHVVRDDFPGGVRELKEQLALVKGTLVEMPLTFLQDEDIAKEGLTLNPLTEPIYT